MEPQQQTPIQPPQKKYVMSVGAAIILGISGIIIAAIIAGAIVASSGVKTLRDFDFENFEGFQAQVNEQEGYTTVNVDVKKTELQEEAQYVTYNGGDFLFQYDKTAEIEMKTYGSGATFFDVFKIGGVGEQIRIVEGMISYESFCGPDIILQKMILQGKEVVYCDSQAEPARTYFFNNGQDTIILNVQGGEANASLMYSYIDPRTVTFN